MYDQDELVDSLFRELRYCVIFREKVNSLRLMGINSTYEVPILRFNVSLRTRIVKRWLGIGNG